MSSPAPGWRRLLGLFLREQGKAHPLPDLGVVARGGSPSWFHNNADGSGFEAAAFRLFGSALNAPDFLEGKNTMVGLTALTLAGGAILGLSGLATPAAACDLPQDVRIRGAKANWTEYHNGRRTQVDGWVKDNKADGKCAEVYSMFSNGTTQKSNRACPRGEVERFHFDAPAGDAQTYLRLVG